MIIWCGIIDNKVAYRNLGTSNQPETSLVFPNAIRNPDVSIAHSEGTTVYNGTTPTIGSGPVKELRDFACKGIAVGVTPNKPEIEPTSLKRSEHCVMTHDTEREFYGNQSPSCGGRMLCATILCSCGCAVLFSCCKVVDIKARAVACKSNAQMAISMINEIMLHAPLFIVGHNVHTFDNVLIAEALPSKHKFRKFFRPTHHMFRSHGNMGLILCTPGINNLDTFRYISKARTQEHKGFSLASIADQLNLVVGKGSTASVKFNLHWHERSDHNAKSAVKHSVNVASSLSSVNCSTS